MTKLFKLSLVAVIVAFFSLSLNAQTPTSPSKADVDALLQRVQTMWKVPAIGLSIVKDGEIVYAECSGVLNLQEGAAPADAQTQFVNASTSKAFTSALIGIMVDKGYIKWDDPVVKHLSDFQLYDEWMTQNFLVMDIMCHRSGFPAYALDEMPAAGFNRDDLYRMFRFIRPVHPFRTQYAYTNCTFTIAARIIEKYTGLCWDDAVAQYIFKPLEMNGTTTGKYGFPDSPHLAEGCRLSRDGDNLIVKERNTPTLSYDWCNAVAPAAFVMSTANDMGHWMQMLLNKGNYKGQQILKPETLEFIFKPQMLCSTSPERVLLYAQGWRVEQGAQGKIIQHTGLASGYTALVTIIPELNLGVSVLMNQGNTNQPHYSIARQIIDAYRGVESDWPKKLFAEYMEPSAPRSPRPKEEVIPALANAAYVGNYYKEVFGLTPVYEKDGKLYMKMGIVDGPLKHLTGNKFSMEVRDETFRMEFHIGETGRADSYSLLFDYDLGPFERLEN